MITVLLIVSLSIEFLEANKMFFNQAPQSVGSVSRDEGSVKQLRFFHRLNMEWDDSPSMPPPTCASNCRHVMIGTECCETVTVGSTSNRSANQNNRFGDYIMTYDSATCRFYFDQVNGDEFLYFLENSNIWMIGSEVFRNLGGILAREGALCPEDSTRWQYFSGGWQDDPDMAATCKEED